MYEICTFNLVVTKHVTVSRRSVGRSFRLMLFHLTYSRAWTPSVWAGGLRARARRWNKLFSEINQKSLRLAAKKKQDAKIKSPRRLPDWLACSIFPKLQKHIFLLFVVCRSFSVLCDVLMCLVGNLAWTLRLFDSIGALDANKQSNVVRQSQFSLVFSVLLFFSSHLFEEHTSAASRAMLSCRLQMQPII